MLVTRAPEQSADLSRLLEEQGAIIVSAPLIRIGPPPSERSLQDAVDRAGDYDWLVFTSAPGVEAFARRRRQPLPAGVRIAVVGSATGAAVTQRLTLKADLMPAEHSAGALALALVHSTRAGERALILAARDASPVLAAELRRAGLAVDKVAAYTTMESPPPDLQARIARCDVITLASPSAVSALVHGIGDENAHSALRGKLIACIGPVTLLEARQRGLHVEVVPEQATLPALVEALCRYFSSPGS